MLSSMGFHISSLSASLLPGRSWLPGIRVGKWDARRALIAEVLRSFDACGQALSDTGTGTLLVSEWEMSRRLTEEAGSMRRSVTM